MLDNRYEIIFLHHWNWTQSDRIHQFAPHTMKYFLSRYTTSWFIQKPRDCKSSNSRHEEHQDRSDWSLTDNLRQEDRTCFFIIGNNESTLKASSSACRTRIIFHRLVDYLSVLSTYQIRNRVWWSTQSTTCCRKVLLRNLHGIKTVSYLKNKNLDNNDVPDRLWDLEGERTNLSKRTSM